MTRNLQSALAEGDAGRALALIRALPAVERDQFLIAAHEADLLGRLGRHEEELAILQRLAAQEGAHPGLQLSIANALKTLGRTDEAIAAVRSALAVRPGYGKAWWLLADLKTYRFADPEVAAMDQALQAAADPADRRNLHFALGRAFEQRGEAERAFAHYREGNALAAAAMPVAAPADRIDRLAAAFTSGFFAAREGFGHDSAEPIFILGLNRSGSTLIEQVLAGHPEIEATGELPIIGQLVRRLSAGGDAIAAMAALDESEARALGAEYLARAAPYRQTDKPRFIDKMPSNWLHVGFIRLILPNARIVDARRHPMAAGFSNFRQNYERGAVWSFSLAGIGRYYRDYLRLMRHYDRALPGWVHHLIHERLVEDFEPGVRRLLDFVGVAFYPACLDFHRSNRPVRSASAEQVRRPLTRKGFDEWRAFEPWLEPLKQALGPDLEDWQE